MAGTIRTSELPLEVGIPTGEELIEISTVNTENNISAFASKKTSLSNMGKWIFNHMPFFNLKTNNKTIVGAINEIKNSGGSSISAEPNAGAHNAIYRGECLGTTPTAAQYAAIDNGSFDDMFIGDYWYDPNEGIHWRIAGFNYYQGTGTTNTHRVLTNHVVIIPDECIIGDTYTDLNNNVQPTVITEQGFGGHLGEYPHSLARGYKVATETFIVNQEPSSMGTDCIMSIPLQHIPMYEGRPMSFYVQSYVMAVVECNIIDSEGIAHPSYVRWNIDITNANIEDPNNPGHGIIYLNSKYTGRTYQGQISTYYQRSQYSILYSESDLDPFRLVSATERYAYILYFPIGTEVTIYYMYHDENIGCLNKAKDIIKNKFGSNHIMQRYTSFADYQGTEYKSHFFDVELPTSEMIFGHSAMTGPNGEYNQFEGSEMKAASGRPALLSPTSYSPYITYRGHYTETDYVNTQSGSAISYDLNRLPLFFYNPSLIHIGYGYWLKNMYSFSNISSNFGFHLNECKNYFIAIDASGTQVGDIACIQRLNTGIRPVFCLANTNEPYVE